VHLTSIGKRNGLLGIGLCGTAVCGTDAIAAAKTIQCAVNNMGVEKLAQESDFDGAMGSCFDVTGLPLTVKALQEQRFSRAEIEMIRVVNAGHFFFAQPG
jgi:membrane dipeptidase